MNAKLKAKWIKALRSDNFKQGQQLLHDPDTNQHCCLGVLCVVANKSLDVDAYRWLDRVTGSYVMFAMMNDDHGKSFKEIANYIEANL